MTRTFILSSFLICMSMSACAPRVVTTGAWRSAAPCEELESARQKYRTMQRMPCVTVSELRASAMDVRRLEAECAECTARAAALQKQRECTQEEAHHQAAITLMMEYRPGRRTETRFQPDVERAIVDGMCIATAISDRDSRTFTQIKRDARSAGW